MSEILSTDIYNLIESISTFSFNQSEHTMKTLEKVTMDTPIFTFSTLFFFVSLLVAGFILFRRWLSLRGSNYRLIDMCIENKRKLSQLLLISIIALFPGEIIQFTFGFWDSLIDNSETFQLLKEKTLEIEDGFLAHAMVLLLISSIVLFITILQIVETLSLIALLLISPVIIIGGLFNKKLSTQFNQTVLKGVANPIIQTVFMYTTIHTTIHTMIPAISSNEQLQPLMQTMFLMMILLLNIRIPHVMNSLFFVQPKTEVSK